MIEVYPIPQPGRDAPPVRHQRPDEICEHRFELRRMLCSNGTIQFRRQCPQCGKGLQASSIGALSQQEREQAPPYDRELQEAVRRASWEQWRASRDNEQQRQWQEWYDGYLASPVWHRRRAAVLKRNPICESCEKARSIIAHHLTYEHVGAEPLFELRAACSSCHEHVHPREAQ